MIKKRDVISTTEGKRSPGFKREISRFARKDLFLKFYAGLAVFFFLGVSVSSGEETVNQIKANVTVLVASNHGNDFNLINDAYRDELIQLFSYTSYNQVNAVRRDLVRGVPQRIDLPESYELLLTLQGRENGRFQVQAVIRKGGVQYVDTILSILEPGVVFVGGPQVEKGALIIVLETGF